MAKREYIPYAEQLKSPKWQKKRLEILERDNWTCQLCNGTEEQLHVHHTIYLPNRMAWEYENIHLVALCHACHADEKEAMEEQTSSLISVLKGRGYLSSHTWALANHLTGDTYSPMDINKALHVIFNFPGVMDNLLEQYRKDDEELQAYFKGEEEKK